MSLPTFKVEIAWASQPFSGALTWTDISSDVQLKSGIPITFGRQDQYSQTQASTFKVTVDNQSGKYSPDNTGSVLYPNVLIGKAARVTATEGAGFFPRVYGYVDSITVSWNDETGLWSNVDITCVDLLKVAARRLLTDNIVSTYYLADSPADYWDLGDTDGTVNPRNRTGVTILRSDKNLYASDSAVTYGSGTGVSTDGLSAVQVVNSRLLAAASPSYGVHNAATFTAEGFIRLENGSASTQYDVITLIADGASAGTTRSFFLSVLDTATTGWGSGGASLTGTTSLLDGATHHVACTFDGTTFRLYVDGAQEASSTPGAFSWPTDSYIGTVASSANSPIASPSTTLTADHVAFYTTALSAAKITTHASSGLTGFSGETSGARFTRIAALFGITPTVVAPMGTATMGPLKDVDGRSLLDLLQEVQDTENGQFYVDPSGNLTLVGRSSLYNQATALSLAAGSYEADIQFTLDDTLLMNDFTATGTSGLPQEYVSATSVANYGTVSGATTLNTTDDAEAMAYAQWRVGTGNPLTRAPQISVDLMTQQTLVPGLLAAWWAVTPGERVTVSGLPGSAPATSVSLQVQGWTETLSDSGYDVQINTSGVPIQGWLLGDAVLSVLGTTTTLVY